MAFPSKQVVRSWLLAATLMSGGAAAQSPDDAAGKIYRLGADASYHETCFAPCDCPPTDALAMQGALVLGSAVPGNAVDFHRVADIYWTAGDRLEPQHTITGRGVYRISNFGPPQSHSLDLGLVVDDGEPRHFFSDLVPAPEGLLSLDIPVSLNGMFCHDTVIRVSAAPANDVIRYRLHDDSSYQQGCFDPCDCILEDPRAMGGRFDLVPLFDFGTIAGFAVTRSRFFVAPSPDHARLRFAGPGQYILLQGFGGPADTMALNLRSGRMATRFDSPLRNTSVQFPAISVSVDMNDGVCFDRVLNINASPVP